MAPRSLSMVMPKGVFGEYGKLRGFRDLGCAGGHCCPGGYGGVLYGPIDISGYDFQRSGLLRPTYSNS